MAFCFSAFPLLFAFPNIWRGSGDKEALSSSSPAPYASLGACAREPA